MPWADRCGWTSFDPGDGGATRPQRSLSRASSLAATNVFTWAVLVKIGESEMHPGQNARGQRTLGGLRRSPNGSGALHVYVKSRHQSGTRVDPHGTLSTLGRPSLAVPSTFYRVTSYQCSRQEVLSTNNPFSTRKTLLCITLEREPFRVQLVRPRLAGRPWSRCTLSTSADRASLFLQRFNE